MLNRKKKERKEKKKKKYQIQCCTSEKQREAAPVLSFMWNADSRGSCLSNIFHCFENRLAPNITATYQQTLSSLPPLMTRGSP